jgi:hypothetical protein
MIKSLEFVEDENLLVTSAFDKKVKLWNSLDGSYVDSF